MKKKLLLLIATVAILTCLFAIVVGAEAKIADETATLSDGTVLDLFDENGDGLIWYIFSTDENGVNTYKSVAVNDNTKDNATSYVTYNVNSTYGTNQMHDIYINYWDADNSKYVSYGEKTIVIANLSTLKREYWSIGDVFSNTLFEYVYHASTVRSAGDFSGFAKLQLVDFYLSTNYTSFDQQAFRGCKALREVRFGDSETGYVLNCKDDNLFEGCTSLTTLKFADPSVVTSIGGRAFYGCTALTGTYTFSGVKSISNEAFRYSATNEGTNLVLSFPSIETLGVSGDTHVFSNSGLKEIYLGKTLTGIKLNTFTSCNKLWKIEIEEGVKNFSFSSYTFEQCTALKAFSIPEGITALPQRMFSGCTSLTAVYLPSTLTTIDTGSQGHSTFFDCHNMYFVSSPFTFDSVDDIPEKEDVYYFPSTLTTITGGELFKVCKSLNKTLVFPVGVTTISNAWAFEATINNPTLENIVFLGDMENINTTTWKLTGKIYFANENDKSASDIATYKNSKSTVFCHAEDNTTHLYEKTVITPATCTENSYKIEKCFCGAEISKVKLQDALGHNYNAVVTEPDCTNGGYTTYTCSVCGDTYVDSQVDALGHSYNSVVTEPDCLNGGYTTHTCSICGDTYVDSQVDALGHSYNAVVIAPTCETEGYTTYTCSVCGDSYVDNEVDALGHNLGDWTFNAETAELVKSCQNGCGKTETKAVEATANGEYYETLADAILAGGEVVLLKNVEINSMIVVAKDSVVTLDLNGKTITGKDTTSKNFSILDNRGTLTIKDEVGGGKFTLAAEINSGWNRYSAVIANNPGGKLTVNGGTIEHLGGTDMAYGIDNLTNGKGTYAETIINGGVVKSTYRAIRQFLNGIEAQNILTINGGTIEGANKSIFFHDPSKNANSGTLTISENATINGDIYLFVTAGSTDWPVEVSIEAEATVLTANIPNGYAVLESEGKITSHKHSMSGWTLTTAPVYGEAGEETNKCANCDYAETRAYNAAAKIGDVYYATFAEAYDAKEAGATIVLLAPITVTSDMTLNIDGITIESAGDVFVVTSGTLTIDGNGVVKAGTAGVGSWCAVWANGGNVVINGGTYSVGGDSSSNPLHQNDLIYTKNGGKVTINGGTFIAGEGIWALNENDANRGTITVNGGKFVGFNPANNVSEGEGTNFVADGYAVVANGTEFTVVNAAAKIGDVYYATFEEAYDAKEAGTTIVLLAPITVASDMTLNIDGITIESAGDVFVVTGGTLTIEGNGVVNAGKAGVGSWCAVWANGGTVVINGGTYSVGGDSSSDPLHQNDLIYTKNGGKVTINGGTFIAGEGIWALNENDANRGTITVNGGKFVGFNPANNVSEGEGTNFVADGYHAQKVDNVYTVAPHSFVLNDIVYKNGFENAGVKINTCAGCGATYEEATEAIFKNLGLSASEFEVGGITIGYKVNTEFLEEYEAVTGNEITYGVFAVLADKIGNGDILNEKGTPAAGVINKEIKSYGINEFNFKLVGFTTEKLMSAKIVMGAYVFERTQEGVNVSYIQPNVPQEGERYYAVSYNGLTGKED